MLPHSPETNHKRYAYLYLLNFFLTHDPSSIASVNTLSATRPGLNGIRGMPEIFQNSWILPLKAVEFVKVVQPFLLLASVGVVVSFLDRCVELLEGVIPTQFAEPCRCLTKPRVNANRLEYQDDFRDKYTPTTQQLLVKDSWFSQRSLQKSEDAGFVCLCCLGSFTIKFTFTSTD